MTREELTIRIADVVGDDDHPRDLAAHLVDDMVSEWGAGVRKLLDRTELDRELARALDIPDKSIANGDTLVDVYQATLDRVYARETAYCAHAARLWAAIEGALR